MDQLRAHDGSTFPAIGFGTYALWGVEGSRAVSSALQNGYRLIDSAFNYENEGAVGQGIRESGVDRAEIIVTSKLPGRHHDYDEALRTIEESVYRLGGDPVDLYLIHWPNPEVGLYVDAWRALVDARERGFVKHIGVSNFLPEHLERIEEETGVRPVINQIELHPYFPQEVAVDYHRERGIIIEAWSPIGRAGEVLEEPVIAEIAKSHAVTPSQVVLAWHVARGVVPLPKSANDERQRENLAAADIALTPEEVASITALGRSNGRLRGQDPAVYEEF